MILAAISKYKMHRPWAGITRLAINPANAYPLTHVITDFCIWIYLFIYSDVLRWGDDWEGVGGGGIDMGMERLCCCAAIRLLTSNVLDDGT